MATDYVNVPDRPVKFHEGWLDHKSQDNVWRRYWCVLRNNVIFIFNSQRTSQQEHVGTIELGVESRFENRDGDEKTGYRFDLYTRRRINRFKTVKFSERELWRAFVEGIASGKVPDSIDLLPGQIEDIRSLLRQLYGGRPPAQALSAVPGARARRVSEPSKNYMKEGFDSPNSSTSGSFPVDDPENTDCYLEPTSPRSLSSSSSQRLLFNPDPSKKEIPSWFFPSCTRDLAEKILTRCPGLGNTLMRENTTTSNLVISKRMESPTGPQFTHFILQCTPHGYKIDVENPHEPMKSLCEVMDFFVMTSGASTTQPMACNDLKLLGLEDLVYNNYNKKIVKFSHDADSGEETLESDVSKNWSPIARNVGYSQTAKPTVGKTKTSVKDVFGGGVQGRNARSQSVPSISPEDLAQIQATRMAQMAVAAHGSLSSRSLRSDHYINAPKETSSSNRNLSHPAPPLPPTYPPSSSPAASSVPKPPPAPALPSISSDPSIPVAPPLPPNHPPPLIKAKSQPSGLGSQLKQVNNGIVPVNSATETVTKTVPQHSQSLGAADSHTRKAVHKHTQSASAADELATVAARIINKKKEPPPVAKKPPDSAAKQQIESAAKPEDLDGVETGARGATESFKKKLEGLLSPTSPPGQAALPQNSPIFKTPTQPSSVQAPAEAADQEVYESIDHYQNVDEIRKSSQWK